MDKLEVGDIFYIKVLDETLAYQIDQILTVLPQETDSLSIEPGKDYATLVTCTPFAINTHRLLVRGERIPYEEATKQEPDTNIKPELSFKKRDESGNVTHVFKIREELRRFCVKLKLDKRHVKYDDEK